MSAWHNGFRQLTHTLSPIINVLKHFGGYHHIPLVANSVHQVLAIGYLINTRSTYLVNAEIASRI